MKLPLTINYIAKSGLMLMPHSYLPIVIDRPKEIAQIESAITKKRFLGIIQPLSAKNSKCLYNVGCVGKIISFTEHQNSNLSIVLEGIKRFSTNSITAKILNVNYDKFYTDNIIFKQQKIQTNRKAQVISALQEYSKTINLDINWTEINNLCEETLVNNLAMICPFNPQQKQAILESGSVYDRIQMLTAFMEIESSQPCSNRWIIN